MTTWELPEGYGRVKPDIVTFGEEVIGAWNSGGCNALSGTSVACPVVSGVVALLMSTVAPHKRQQIINPASIKQALAHTSERIPEANIFEQGFGRVNLLSAYEYLSKYETPIATFLPSSIDTTDCPYWWPYCLQPIFYSSSPLLFNVTILNAMGVTGEIPSPPIVKAGKNANLLRFSFDYPKFLWPWVGYFAIHLSVTEEAEKVITEDQTITAEAIISVKVVSPPNVGETQLRTSTIDLPLRLSLIKKPPRSKRILFDQFHSLRYPSGYFPRDALRNVEEPFDWNGDHLHTNYQKLYNFLRSKGYFVEVLGSPFTCFNASLYSSLFVFDSEDEFFPQEVEKIHDDVHNKNLNLVVFADWYFLFYFIFILFFILFYFIFYFLFYFIFYFYFYF